MGKIDILVVGAGGREHALVWKISQSRLAGKIFCAPGNAGIAEIAECVPIDVENVSGLLEFAKKKKIGLTIVGPEAPLVKGIVDEFQKNGLKVFGPSKNAAMLEGSKAFAKKLMQDIRVPTASFQVVTEIDEALELVQTMDKAVIKADGLAAGKGVFVCTSKSQILDAVNKILRDRIFDHAGERAIIEELLEGEEASVLAFCDGENVSLMPSAQDHKRVFDNDKGENTGGMGAYSPAPVITPALEKEILEKIMIPVVREMKKHGTPYVGVLYAGLMITKTGPKVLEFNARFGDPETQVILPRLESDLVEIMLSCIDGKLAKQEIKWNKKAVTCVVLVSGGYPNKYDKGKKISGLDKLVGAKGILVFHAGTMIGQKAEILSNGGRVLGVTGLGLTVKGSIAKAYEGVSKISFEKMHFRKDIGKKALERAK